MKILRSILIAVIAAIGGIYLGAYLQKDADSQMLRESAARLGLPSEEFNRHILEKQESSNSMQVDAQAERAPVRASPAPIKLTKMRMKISTLFR